MNEWIINWFANLYFKEGDVECWEIGGPIYMNSRGSKNWSINRHRGQTQRVL